MSIDARVERVAYEPDGTVTLHLVDRDSKSCRGQSQLTVVNPQPGMDAMEGVCIWGNASKLYVRDTLFANRVSYTTIELVGK